MKELREILLQDQEYSNYSEERVVEGLEVIMTELIHGSPLEAWRKFGFGLLWAWADQGISLDVMKVLEYRTAIISSLVSQFQTS